LRRAGGRGPWPYLVRTGLTGMIVSWLHPWQGITLLVILGGLWAWSRFDRAHLILAAPAALTALPLAYFAVLTRTDSAWAQFSRPNDFAHVGLWFALGFAPAVLAIPAMRRRGAELDVQERLLRLWPVAALAVYAALHTGWIYQALAGMTLPLAILVVRSLRGLRLPRPVVALALAAVTLPGMVFLARSLALTAGDHFFAPADRAALHFLERSQRPGPVLAPQRIGQAVPAFSGRSTWVGHYQWTPDYGARRARAEALFAGTMAPQEARRVVVESGVAFLLAGCGTRADLRPALGPLITGMRRIGCATVYEVGRPG